MGHDLIYLFWQMSQVAKKITFYIPTLSITRRSLNIILFFTTILLSFAWKIFIFYCQTSESWVVHKILQFCRRLFLVSLFFVHDSWREVLNYSFVLKDKFIFLYLKINLDKEKKDLVRNHNAFIFNDMSAVKKTAASQYTV